MFASSHVFADRSDAGRRLAERLARFRNEQPLVLALPRDGVPVGFEVARTLDAPLDLILVRKIGAPFQPELAIGAVVDGDQAQTVLNRDLVADVADRTAIVIDDGIATGATVEAALRAIRRAIPRVSCSRCRWRRRTPSSACGR